VKNFGLIGAAGYIAPRHMQAIKETGNNLKVALDPSDSVGIMDSYFPDASFFTETERFDRHIDKLKHKGQGLDYISVCSPNYLHDSHVRLGLRAGCDVICEKPLVLNPKNIDYLKILEEQTGKKINNILQLRHHYIIKELKNSVENSPKDKIYDFDLTYITSRGLWYHHSWKGDESKSGGLVTNIGVHFFDMLMWIFGGVEENIVHERNKSAVSGTLRLERANVRWFLSCDYNRLPQEVKDKGQRTFRNISIDGNEMEFSKGFTDLHIKSYQEILNGNGFRIEEVKPSIQLVYDIAKSELVEV
jgi:UDP-N-acetyl-2-amino-2-deoxyglucuronate dehydrogenase